MAALAERQTTILKFYLNTAKRFFVQDVLRAQVGDLDKGEQRKTDRDSLGKPRHQFEIGQHLSLSLPNLHNTSSHSGLRRQSPSWNLYLAVMCSCPKPLYVLALCPEDFG
jgi:hypothetical protein